MSSKTVWFLFAEAVGYSGQYEASRILEEAFESSGIRTRRVLFPALNREVGGLRSLLHYIVRVFRFWVRCLPLLWRPRDPVHLNAGQTLGSAVRDLFTITLCRVSRRRVIGVALHGNTFCGWHSSSLVQRLFTFSMNRSTCVSVLSERQKDILKSFGVKVRINVIPNSCSASTGGVASHLTKHLEESRMRVLHLSSLIDTKGYPEFLEGLLLLAKRNTVQIDAVLCGQYVASQYARRFRLREEAEAWIVKMIDEINALPSVRIRWIRGAFGDEKWKLLNNCDVFVFPSIYAVEAQPIVLIEAISQGCVCIATDVGDIDTIFPVGGYRKLRAGGELAPQVTRHIEELSAAPELRAEMARMCYAHYQHRFSKEAYFESWLSMLQVNCLGVAE
jgi:glycosyltransferase involved in cell wall biosynthesis